jgi:hypothetical protein
MFAALPAPVLVRRGLAFGTAVIVSVLGVAAVHMQIVLADLAGLGVPIPLSDRLAATLVTMRGFIPTLGPVLALGFAVGFATAAVLKRVLKPIAWAAYPAAGATAMAVALVLMHLDYETTPIASARTPLGFAALCAVAALAGWLFGRLSRPESRPARYAEGVIRKAFSLLPSGSRK